VFEPNAIREHRQLAAAANEVRLLCPHCSGPLYVPLGWSCSPVIRQRKISEAINEHRAICTAAPSEAGRVYRIDYPRL
jgi:hypothetical protein